MDPPYDHPDYRSSALRAPQLPLLLLPHTLSELTRAGLRRGRRRGGRRPT